MFGIGGGQESVLVRAAKFVGFDSTFKDKAMMGKMKSIFSVFCISVYSSPILVSSFQFSSVY